MCELLALGDPDWIIILIFIHINAFRVEKVEDSIHKTILINVSQFGKLRFKTFRMQFEASNNIFGGKKLFSSETPPSTIRIHRYLSNISKIT